MSEKHKIEAVTVGQTIAAVTELGSLDRRVGRNEASRHCSNPRFSGQLWASYCESYCTNGENSSNLQELTETRRKP